MRAGSQPRRTGGKLNTAQLALVISAVSLGSLNGLIVKPSKLCNFLGLIVSDNVRAPGMFVVAV